MDKLASLSRRINTAYPELAIEAARLHNTQGQFSDVLIVNKTLIFRFPRSLHLVRDMQAELDILDRLKGRLPLSIPEPVYRSPLDWPPEHFFMGYHLIPGEALHRETLATMTDADTLNRLAQQLAEFMIALHQLPVADLGTSINNTRADWAKLYEGFRGELFPLMRPAACEQVTQEFESFLREPEHFNWTPAFRHGDFGPGNIIWDPQARAITGVIDFTFAGPGDPAADVAGIATAGDDFLRRLIPHYPAITGLLPRARFYKSTFALQQALYALRDSDQDEFKDGIADYR